MTAAGSDGWVLAIDVGTTYTAGATLVDGRAELVTLDGEGRLPSSVFWLSEAEGLAVGRIADNQAEIDPTRYEPTPKRRVGEDRVLLGGTELAPAALIAALLAAVAREAHRQRGGRPPREVRLTHPAAWAGPRLAVLGEAARLAGLAAPRMVPEPVAAAWHYAAGRRVPVGAHLAVYDLGGGTFDVAVLRRTAEGFAVVSQGGLDPLGGVDFDHRLLVHVGRSRLEAERPDAWSALLDPPDQSWRRAQRRFVTNVRQAKEALSTHSSIPLFVPGADVDALVTRAELEALVGPDLERTVEETRATLARAGVSAQDLGGVYLTGGSSRIPLAARLLSERLGLLPLVLDDPKSVVALGAALAPLDAPAELDLASWVGAMAGQGVDARGMVERLGWPREALLAEVRAALARGPSAAAEPALAEMERLLAPEEVRVPPRPEPVPPRPPGRGVAAAAVAGAASLVGLICTFLPFAGDQSILSADFAAQAAQAILVALAGIGLAAGMLVAGRAGRRVAVLGALVAVDGLLMAALPLWAIVSLTGGRKRVGLVLLLLAGIVVVAAGLVAMARAWGEGTPGGARARALAIAGAVGGALVAISTPLPWYELDGESYSSLASGINSGRLILPLALLAAGAALLPFVVTERRPARAVAVLAMALATLTLGLVLSALGAASGVPSARGGLFLAVLAALVAAVAGLIPVLRIARATAAPAPTGR